MKTIATAVLLLGCSIPTYEFTQDVREHTGSCELSYVELLVPEGVTLQANDSTGVTDADVMTGCWARYNASDCAPGGTLVKLWAKSEEQRGYELVTDGECLK